MTVDQIYEQLARRRLAFSLRALSRDWLGSAENYACCLGPDGIPSLRALRFLFVRLQTEGHLILAARVARSILWGDRSDG
jgi:hypothetical protein